MSKHGKGCNKCVIRQVVTPFGRGRSAADMPSYNNGINKPIMGWSTWNCFRNRISEDKIRGIAKKLVDFGLVDAGYKYLNLDDNWHSSMRDKDGNLQGDLGTFPSGIPALIKELNGMGFKVGLYSSNGALTCEDLPASLGNEERDAYTFAKWGAEFVKYDFCHHKPYPKRAPKIIMVSFIKTGGSDLYKLPMTLARLDGKARLVEEKDLPTGAFVDGLNANKGIVTVDDLTVEEEGEYVMTLTTRKWGRKDKFIIAEINGEPYHVTVPGCKKNNQTARVQATVRLKEGKNIVKLYNPVEHTADGYVFQYRYMGEMLKKATKKVAEETQSAEKPIYYSICEWGFNRPYKWGAGAGNAWRTTPDIRPIWLWIKMIYDHNVKLYKHAVKGGYNDPDMLEVGNGGLSYEENKSHFTLWAMMNAPLVIGHNLENIVDERNGEPSDNYRLLEIWKNKKIIALDQDEKSKQCKRLKRGAVDVLGKPLSDGTAFCFFNRTSFEKKFKIDLKKYTGDEYIEFPKAKEYIADNLWKDESFKTDGKIEVSVPAHGVAVYKLQPVD